MPLQARVILTVFLVLSLWILFVMRDEVTSAARWIIGSLIATVLGVAVGAKVGGALGADGPQEPERARPGVGSGLVIISLTVAVFALTNPDTNDLMLWCSALFVPGLAIGLAVVAGFRYSRGDFRATDQSV